MLAIGLLIFSAGSIWRTHFAHGAPVADGAIGFMYGLGIGIVLVAIWRKRRCGIQN